MKNDRNDGIPIARDFQGWPIYKRTLRWILSQLGALESAEGIRPSGKYTQFVISTDLLDKYPEVMEDDGMGYSPEVKYISEAEIYNEVPRMWVDKEDVEYMSSPKDDDSYSAFPWPEAQDYFNELWFKEEACFDPSKNLWFIPNKYIK